MDGSSRVRRFPRRIATALATTILVLGGIGMTFARADAPGQTYTGCLKYGLVFHVALGSNPARSCPSGAVKISWNQTGQPGANGQPGAPGQDGTDGVDGTDGIDGQDGDSAYEIWLGLGNTGTEQDFIDSLKGEPGSGGDRYAGLNCQQNLSVVGFDADGEILCGRGTNPPRPPVGRDCVPLNAVPGADLRSCELRNEDLTGLDLSGADLSFANLVEAVLAGVDLSQADLSDANLTAAVLTGADLTGVDLTNADLNGADLTGAILTGATWDNTSCPDGSLSDFNPNCGF